MSDLSPPTLVVCGDSVFDNRPYVGPGGRDVESHLAELAADWSVDFRAVDGAVCEDVRRLQIDDDFRADAIVMSVGGNDGLGHLQMLADPKGATFLATALTLAEIQAAFREEYRAAAGLAAGKCGRLVVATIYRPRFHLDGYPEVYGRAVEPLLSIFNDVIQEEAARLAADVLDLRRICVADEDFANPIEPSDPGGRKIAARIVEMLGPR